MIAHEPTVERVIELSGIETLTDSPASWVGWQRAGRQGDER